jgi:hypothetical protein
VSASRVDLAAIRDRVGDVEAYAGVRLVTLSDGHERGVRLLEFRSGGGLEFEVVIDRGFDIGRLSVAAQTFSWHSPTGLRAPWLLDRASDRGQGFLRGFSGLMTTCGLDHIRQPETVAVVDNGLHPTGMVDHPLHGSGTFSPGRLLGYGMSDGLEGPMLWCSGEMRQAMVFGACLSLRRRIACPVGGNRIEIVDCVENIGATPSPHLLLYHLNFGYPLIDIGARPHISSACCMWQSHEHDALAPFPEPTDTQSAELSVHNFDERGGEQAVCGIENPETGARAEIAFDPRELPFCQLLRLTGRRLYTAAIEPCTTGRRTQIEAAQHGEVRHLKPGEQCHYTLRLSFTAGRHPALS